MTPEPDWPINVGIIEGHSSWVNSIACSDDKTICVWNAKTGDLVMGPMKGHHDSVRSVAYSPGWQVHCVRL
jgi:WD40 repeat protein